MILALAGAAKNIKNVAAVTCKLFLIKNPLKCKEYLRKKFYGGILYARESGDLRREHGQLKGTEK